ncbi:MAG: hypothetical protein ACYTFX_06220, partial [Planctomycetota bacterium]
MAGRNSHLSNASIFFSLFIVSVVVFLWPKSDTAKISMFFQATFQRLLTIGRDAGTPPERLHPDSKNTFSRSEYTQLWKDYKNVYAQLMAVHDENERLAKLRTGL